jgi:amidohydrolase
MTIGILAVSAALAAGSIDLEAFYKDLHRHPELGFKEKRTAGKLAAGFKSLGLKTYDDVGGGVVAVLENGAGPVTMVRSELDALPVTEATGLPYASENPGVMHACGHDLHATILLGTAEAMAKQKAAWHGTLIFVGQPAEEILGGAKRMLEAGLVKMVPKPDQIIALHTASQVETGKIGFMPPGPVQTAADNFDVTFRGIGSHGSIPHRGVDPIVLASEFVIKMQTMVSREIDPQKTAVVTVGSFHGGTARNVIPEEVKLQLTMRSYDADVRAILVKRVHEIAFGLAKVAGAPEPTVTAVEQVPSVVNDKGVTERFKKGVVAAIGEGLVIDSERIMPSEDFSLYGPAFGAPAMRWQLGTASDENLSIANHSPRFAPQVKTVLPLGVKATVAGLMELHAGKPASSGQGL